MAKTVSVKINAFLKQGNILEELQLGFWTDHKTETALGKISNCKLNSGENKVSILVPLELSAAFDTIDHDTILKTCSAFLWIKLV